MLVGADALIGPSPPQRLVGADDSVRPFFLRPHFLFSARKGNGVARQRKRGLLKSEVHPVPPSCNNSVVRSYLPAPRHLSAGNYAPHAILMMAVI